MSGGLLRRAALSFIDARPWYAASEGRGLSQQWAAR